MLQISTAVMSSFVSLSQSIDIKGAALSVSLLNLLLCYYQGIVSLFQRLMESCILIMGFC